jgi:hypothetical protein
MLGMLVVTFSPCAVAVDYIYLDGFEAAVDCSAVLTCPVQPAGKSCIAGQLTSARSGAPLRAFINGQQACGGGAIGGPCDLNLTVFDALEFAGNPAGSTPLTGTEKTVDGCGRFRVAGITPPASGFAAIVADDADPGLESDLHPPAAVMHALGANAQVDGVNVVAATHDTVDFWTQSAGSPFGASSFVDVGVVLLQFSAGATPRAGVTVTLNASSVPTKDYYFSDAAPSARVHVDATLTATGADGAALVANGGSANYSGAGAEPQGCTWPSPLAMSVPGVLVFVPIDC